MKSLIYLIACLVSFGVLRADCYPEIEEEENDVCSPYLENPGPIFLSNFPVICEKNWTLDVRVAYYAPQSKAVRKIYSGSWLDFQVEASNRVWEYVDLWWGVSWAGKEHGHTHPLRYGIKDKTKMFILPVSFGARWIYPVLPCTEVYIGAGVCYSFLEIRNHFKEDDYCSEDFPDESMPHFRLPYKHYIYKNGWGGIFKLGVHYTLGEYTFFDFFVDYYLQRFDFSHNEHRYKKSFFKHHADCSGFKVGAGLGVYF